MNGQASLEMMMRQLFPIDRLLSHRTLRGAYNLAGSTSPLQFVS